MTRKQAIKKLVETREITTGMLKPLNITFDSWLQYAQLDADKRDKIVTGLIKLVQPSEG